jgi:putative oxidoreductase
MTQSLGKFLGRLCLSAVFLVSAFTDIQNWLPMTMVLTHKGFPASPLFLSAAVLLKLAGGASLLTGIKSRWGAWALVVFLVPATILFHDFWASPAAEQPDQFMQFLKNTAILGGLLIVLADSKPPKK